MGEATVRARVTAGRSSRRYRIVTPRHETVTRRVHAVGSVGFDETLARMARPVTSGGAPSSQRATSRHSRFALWHSGSGSGSVVIALVAAIAFGACRDGARVRQSPRAVAVPELAAADPAVGMTTELDGVSPVFVEAELAELTGDLAAARVGFERVLASPGASGAVAGRAALHLAQMEARAGQSRHALDFVARAAALAPADVTIEERIAQLRAEIVAASGAGDLRGPRIGTTLVGVAPEVVTAFAAAEQALAAVHKLRPRALIEALSTSIRAKESATESVVAQYRAVAEHGGVAAVAGHYRAGSLYHDLAINLLFDLPTELDASVAASLRRSLRGRALASLKKAAAEYRAALAVAPTGDAELWRLAAETDLRRALEVLGEAAPP